MPRACPDYYDPWRHAAELDLWIVHRPLPRPLAGYYDREVQTIVLDTRQRQVERRCTLAHELVHFERGDTGCATDWHNRKQELYVSEIAARRLVRLEDLLRGLLVHQDRGELAEDLWVDLDTLTVRLDTLRSPERDYLEHRIRSTDRVA